jgi:hypothetical protein
MKSQELTNIVGRLLTQASPINLGVESMCGAPGQKTVIVKFDLSDIADARLLAFFEQFSILDQCETEPPSEVNKGGYTQSAFTYLMVDRNTGYHKIGKSINPQKRERTLQSEKPVIDLLGYCAGWIVSENELHDKYAHLRVRGEWFNLSKSDVQDILKIFAA